MPHSTTVERLANRLHLPFIAVTMCVDLYKEVAELLLTRPVYFVVTDARFEAKLRRTLSASSATNNLHVLVAGRDDLSTIPVQARVYITQLTRLRIRDRALLDRVLPEARVFSPETCHEVVRFLIQSKAAAS